MLIVELADAEDLYEKPLHPYTQALFSAIPQAEPGSGWLENRVPLTGEVPDPAHVPAGCKFAPRCPYVTERCRQEVPPLTNHRINHLVACWEAC